MYSLASKKNVTLLMDAQPFYTYSVDAALHKKLAGDWPFNEEDKKLLIAGALEELITETARLDNETVKVLVENPWYLTLLIISTVGIMALLIFLLA